MITKAIVNELFLYDGGVIYWKSKPSKFANNSILGSEAGTIHHTGYKVVRILGSGYFIHRVIFLMLNGILPKSLDHIDNNKLNNKIENLREASSRENNMNSSLRKDSKSGVKGVSWSPACNKWQAYITANGERFYLGVFDDKLDAASAVREKRKSLHGIFCNHGDSNNEKDT